MSQNLVHEVVKVIDVVIVKGFDLFVSDVHLSPSRPDITEQFEAFLETRASQAGALYILGDLFEAWIGDDAIGPFELRIAGALRALRDAGVTTYYLCGNRDFLLGRTYCERAGMQWLEQPHCISLNDEPTVLLHGDSLCTLDRQYQRYRRRVTDPKWQQRMLSRPVWVRRGIARLLRLVSRLRNRRPDPVRMDVAPEAVNKLFRASGSTRMIHGHTHLPNRHEHEVDGGVFERIVLGDWYTQGSVLAATPDGLNLESLSRGFVGH
ncbi:MAG: UDP-2,3-diacylglucosamine diphosphatase [Wenzhouxiangellaceae bacterium]